MKYTQDVQYLRIWEYLAGRVRYYAPKLPRTPPFVAVTLWVPESLGTQRKHCCSTSEYAVAKLSSVSRCVLVSPNVVVRMRLH